MITSRINAPDFSGSADSSGVRSSGTSGKAHPGQIRSAGDIKAGVVTASLTPTHSLSQLLTRLGLPQDKLSASIVAFARYFSLPLESGLLTKIRRQGLSAETGNAVPAKAPGEGQPLAAEARSSKSLLQTREALSLAAAAAADKGVELGQESLADYARSLSRRLVIDPDKRHSADGGHGDGGFGTGSGNNGEGSADGEAGGSGGGTNGGNAGRNSNKDRDQGKFTGDTGVLRDKILQAGEQNPLVSLMNRLPGKNGRRWMVFPFSLEDQGRSFAVTLRILLMPEGSAAGFPLGSLDFRAERMALEITGEDRRWLFIIDNPPNGKLGITGSIWPGDFPLEGVRRMEKELAGLLGMEAEQVQIGNDEEFPPFAQDSRDETLLAVNEEV